MMLDLSRTDCINFSAGNTAVTRPASSASCGEIFSPVKSQSLARPNPTSLGRKYITPLVTNRALLTSGNPKNAFSEAIRMSQAKANSAPIPTARPLMAAITTLGIRVSCFVMFAKNRTSRRSLSLADAASDKKARSFRSRPAENARPSPVSIRT